LLQLNQIDISTPATAVKHCTLLDPFIFGKHFHSFICLSVDILFSLILHSLKHLFLAFYFTLSTLFSTLNYLSNYLA